MNVAPQRRAHTAAPTDGSRTITLRDAQPQPRSEDDEPAAGDGAARSSSSAAVGVLKLRGAQRRTRQRVAWGADVVDNEGCGKKKSKICCIYHKPRRFDESSSESDSGSTSDSDGGDRVRPTRRCRHHHASHRHGHEDGSGSASGTARRDAQGGTTVHEIDDSDVNAYERFSKWKT